MTCDLATLLRDGRCFCGATTNKKDIAELQLLCNILSAISGSGGTVQDMQVAWTPTSVNLGNMAGICSDPNFGGVASWPGVVTFSVTGTEVGFVDIENATDLQTVSGPTLVTTDALGYIALISCPVITSVSFPSLVSCFIFTATNSPLLTSVSLPVLLPSNGGSYTFSNSALDAASVNSILARGVANPAFVSGSIRTDGGTNAAPSGQGIADKATLIGRGVTVITN